MVKSMETMRLFLRSVCVGMLSKNCDCVLTFSDCMRWCSDCLTIAMDGEGYTPPPAQDQLKGGLTPHPPKNF